MRNRITPRGRHISRITIRIVIVIIGEKRGEHVSTSRGAQAPRAPHTQPRRFDVAGSPPDPTRPDPTQALESIVTNSVARDHQGPSRSGAHFDKKLLILLLLLPWQHILILYVPLESATSRPPRGSALQCPFLLVRPDQRYSACLCNSPPLLLLSPLRIRPRVPAPTDAFV